MTYTFSRENNIMMIVYNKSFQGSIEYDISKLLC